MKAKILLLFAATFLYYSCGKKTAAEFNSDPALFAEHISYFTGNRISATDNITVVLTFENQSWKPNMELDRNLFEISPEVKGKVIALSRNSIAFVPDRKLSNGAEYQVTFKLLKLKDVAAKTGKFNFTVKTIEQDFVVKTLDIQSYSPNFQYLNATIKTADVLDFELAKRLVRASSQGKDLKIKFFKTAASAKEFRFVVDSIPRSSVDSKLTIYYDGKPIDLANKGSVETDIKGTITRTIPENDKFKVIRVEVPAAGAQELSINFSDPVKPDQDFNGLISIENRDNLKFAVNGNVLKVFFSNLPVATAQSNNADDYNDNGEAPTAEGEVRVEVFQGIESSYGLKLENNFLTTAIFDQPNPEIKFTKNGVILPDSKNLKVNFEAINLNAVDVRIYKIYQNNMLQFLQYNELNGSTALKRVAQPIAKTTLRLKKNSLAELTKWNTFAIDISKIIKPEPGAMYRLELDYRPSYSMYVCTDEMPKDKDSEEEVAEKDVNYSGANDYDYDDYEYYSWRDHENPCTRSYYSNRQIATNVLATNLGVIAKRGADKSLFFAVTDILTTKPTEGADIEIYSYQQQKLTTIRTNSDGIASAKMDNYGYFAIVRKGDQATYLKLDDGLSLSLSNFDVSGQSLQKGLKGFIYLDRGVRRPGDNVNMGFVLDDNASKLPKSHPVKVRLSNPSGKVIYQGMKYGNATNHYAFSIPTNQDAPTGNWEAMVSVGGAKFYKAIKIETIKPNRIKIKNNLNGAKLESEDPFLANIEAIWLHGAVAKNLKVDVKAKFYQQPTTFSGYGDFTFDDITKTFSTDESTVFDGSTDDSGKATFRVEPRLTSLPPGKLKANFITQVHEQGGDVSTDVASAEYSPYETYVGLKLPKTNKYDMLETDTNNRFEIATLNENGSPRSVPNVSVSIYKIDWNWWYDSSADRDFSNYNSSSSTTVYKTFSVNTDAKGRGSFDLKLAQSEWGRYLIRIENPQGGHSTAETVMIDWPSWSGKTRNTDAASATRLQFTTDKKEYNVGDKAIISFPSSAAGRALVSIENGTGVLSTLWAETKKGETIISVPITAAMAPNVYFNISSLQPHASTANDLPIRMYGIASIGVVDKDTKLQPQLSMPNELKPATPFNIKISEKSGRAMSYTIAIVDEGLLDLSRFKTPNAWDAFYAKEALGVKTWDIFDHVLGAFGGKIEQIFSIGGDQDLGASKTKKANRFKPVVVFLGPYTLEKGQSKIHKIKLPQYIGSVRTMVVASSVDNKAYGSTEKTTAVKSPLMLLTSVPRKISPSEKVTIPVTIFALDKKISAVNIQLKTSPNIKIVGSSTQNLTFTSPDEKLAYFNVEVGSATGIGHISVVATSGKEKASYDVEIDLTNPNPVTNTYQDVLLKPKSTQTITWNTFGVDGSNKAQLELSGMPTIDLNRRLNYLISYPHGCVEQTTSSAFPQLYLSTVVAIDKSRAALIQKNVTATIARLNGFQIGNGGFAYWPGSTYADDWGTSYASHFLLEAEKKGYALPASLKSRFLNYQRNEAKNWRFQPEYSNDLAQAYRLYTLALAGSPDLASMNRLIATKNTSNESRLRLAAAYVLAGQKAAAQKLLATASIDPQSTDRGRYYYYGSEDRNLAMTLETLLLLDRKPEAFKTATILAKHMSSSDWMSTQTTAFSLYAMSKFADQMGSKGINVKYGYKGISGTIDSPKTLATVPLTVTTGSQSITLTNPGSATLYVRLLNTGILPIGSEKPESRNLKVNTAFTDSKGKAASLSTTKQGASITASVTITNTSAYRIDNIALSQIVPSGFEIVNTRYAEGAASTNNADYIDIRDDRTNYYFPLKAGETRTFKMSINASYLGTYYFPGLQAEAMYDDDYLARTTGQWINIIK